MLILSDTIMLQENYVDLKQYNNVTITLCVNLSDTW